MKMEEAEYSETSDIKFRPRVITQKKSYNIQNTAKFWNQEFHFCHHVEYVLTAQEHYEELVQYSGLIL
jgi:hypothetical protein